MKVKNDLKTYLLGVNNRVAAARLEIEALTAPTDTTVTPLSAVKTGNLYQALKKISPSLASSYSQVREDLENEERTSWAGTAHEIREILSSMLRILAPNEAVMNEAWFVQAPKTHGPTQKQRVKYILQQQGAGSKRREVASEIDLLEEKVSGLVRATYSRASDAAHRMKGRTEAKRIFRYFEAFTHDLLNLD